MRSGNQSVRPHSESYVSEDQRNSADSTAENPEDGPYDLSTLSFWDFQNDLSGSASTQRYRKSTTDHYVNKGMVLSR